MISGSKEDCSEKKAEELKQKFLSEDFDTRDQALKELEKIKNASVIDFFIDNLKNKDRKIQMCSASALRSIANSRAIKPLLEAMRNPDNKKYMGSFVYALQTHNCENLLTPIIEIALNGTYEAQSHALEILSKQEFNASQEEILKAKKLIKDYLNSENKCDDYKVLIEELSEYIDRVDRVDRVDTAPR